MDPSSMDPSVLATMDLTMVPAGMPPPGVMPNFDNPHSLKGELLIINVIFTTLMALFVAIRLYSRGFISKQFGWDDWFCSIAAAASIAHAVVIREQTKYGYGFHVWDIRASTIMVAIENRIFFANNFPYMACLLFGKLSILLLFSRLFAVSPRTKIVIISAMVFTTLYSVSILSVSVASFVECGSFADMQKPLCVAMGRSISVVQSVINVLTDFLVLLIPLPMTLALNLPLKRKIAVSSVFLTGLLACAASIGRLVSALKTLGAIDIMWIQAQNDVFTVLEMNAVVIASCLLTLPTFFRRCKQWTTDIYSNMKSSQQTSSDKSMSKLPSNEEICNPAAVQEKAAPAKKPKDPYAMITLTNITVMSQEQGTQLSEEEKSVRTSARESGEQSTRA
ncbi:hypothetical protein DM02DRAFT_613440 [Periconia macrospinosa]|uniref:Rhodopsin domain-containing protein n=1 Tax=Periconia macrospinosa TaxID=97972 RepID=A0A2V1DU99_9PLEO|nr:hypothetical protein DM02DRAFT_613440 [Periconia macrospinosa]